MDCGYTIHFALLNDGLVMLTEVYHDMNAILASGGEHPRCDGRNGQNGGRRLYRAHSANRKDA